MRVDAVPNDNPGGPGNYGGVTYGSTTPEAEAAYAAYHERYHAIQRWARPTTKREFIAGWMLAMQEVKNLGTPKKIETGE